MLFRLVLGKGEKEDKRGHRNNLQIFFFEKTVLNREIQIVETKIRRNLVWAVFGKLSYVFKKPKFPLHLAFEDFYACVLPISTYGAKQNGKYMNKEEK